MKSDPNTWLQTHRQTIVILGMLLVLCYEQWKSTSAINDYIIDALQYDPNGYRLWTQFLIMFDQHPVAYVALVAIVFVPVSWFLYLKSPKDSRFMMFTWLAFTISQASIRQGPSFALLAIAILLTGKKGSWLMVIPLTMVKEHAGLVYIIYLVGMKKYRTAVIVGILWGLTFLTIRFLVGYVPFGTDPYTGEISTPLVTLAAYSVRLVRLKVQLYIVAEVLLCVMFLRDRREVLMVILNLPIIIFFGLFYEPQLWLMIMVAIIFRRRVKKEKELGT